MLFRSVALVEAYGRGGDRHGGGGRRSGDDRAEGGELQRRGSHLGGGGGGSACGLGLGSDTKFENRIRVFRGV